MKVNLIRIGNSQGVRIPKALIEQCGFGNEIGLTVQDSALVLRPAHPPRAGWSEAFGRGAPVRDEALLPDYMSEDRDEAEWSW